MTSYLAKPTRTMWDASRDLFESAHVHRCSETWHRGYRLWIMASRMQAPGEPFTLEPYIARWLP